MVPNRPKYQFMREQAADYASFNVLTDVPSLKAWYRADTTTNAGGFVSQLTDKKGSVQYTQGTGSKQPALVASGSDPNGRDCIVFDGVDDCLLGVGIIESACTFFSVTRSIVAPVFEGALFVNGNPGAALSINTVTAASQTRPIQRYENPGGSVSSRYVDTADAVSDARFASSAPSIFVTRHSSTLTASTTPVTRCRLGTPQSSNQTSAATVSTVQGGAGIGSRNGGGSAFLAFGFYERIVCNALLTDDECRKVELYLAGYYGIV